MTQQGKVATGLAAPVRAENLVHVMRPGDIRRGARSAPAGRKFNSLQCVLTLGCLLVILFPVISATDDLCAMQTETEESPASKRTIRQISSDKTPAWKWHTPPALTAKISSLILSDECWLPTLSPVSSTPAIPAIERTGRAPPASFPW